MTRLDRGGLAAWLLTWSGVVDLVWCAGFFTPLEIFRTPLAWVRPLVPNPWGFFVGFYLAGALLASGILSLMAGSAVRRGESPRAAGLAVLAALLSPWQLLSPVAAVMTFMALRTRKHELLAVASSEKLAASSADDRTRELAKLRLRDERRIRLGTNCLHAGFIVHLVVLCIAAPPVLLLTWILAVFGDPAAPLMVSLVLAGLTLLVSSTLVARKAAKLAAEEWVDRASGWAWLAFGLLPANPMFLAGALALRNSVQGQVQRALRKARRDFIRGARRAAQTPNPPEP